MRYAFVLIWVVGAQSAWAASQAWQITAEQWARPRSGERVVQLAPVNEAVRAWGRSGHRQLVIRYPGGEDGILWAGELRDWLVALGVDSGAVRVEPGSPHADSISVVVEVNKDQ